jgi:anti-sigma regulatory factor (Ser/Thr protein kinase)
LWAATEIGVTRFDGKKFKNYTTKDGLSGNEVINIAMQTDGTIWVVPFSGEVNYYNPTDDRFYPIQNFRPFTKLPNSLALQLVALSNNKLFFYANYTLGSIYSKQKVYNVASLTTQNRSRILGAHSVNNNQLALFLETGYYIVNDTGKIVSNFHPWSKPLKYIVAADNIVFSIDDNIVYKYTIEANNKLELVNQTEFPFKIEKLYFNNNILSLTSKNHSLYKLDKNSLSIIDEIFGNYTPRYVMHSKEGDAWISTLSSGLVKTQAKRILGFPNLELQKNITAIYVDKNIFLGDNNGNIQKFDGLYGIQDIAVKQADYSDAKVRRILKTSNGFYAAVEANSKLFTSSGKLMPLNPSNVYRSNKAVAAYSDSVLLLGNHAFAYKYNYYTGKVIDSVRQRVVALNKNLSNVVYLGSNSGLYQWEGTKLNFLGAEAKCLGFQVNTIFTTADNLTWVGLQTDSLVVLNNKEIVAIIPLGKLMPGDVCKALYSNKPGQIWLGTDDGLHRIEYKYEGNKFSYTSNYFSTSDGLFSNDVNDIFVTDSLVYVATNKGLNYLSPNLKLPETDLKVFITDVSVNDAKVPLAEKYNFKYDENNILINFSGVDLTGFIPVFEYRLNNGIWQQAEQIILKNLPADKYVVQIRSLKRDGTASSFIAEMAFTIKAPFWKTTMFWVVLLLALFFLLFWLQSLRNKQKQKLLAEKFTTEQRIAELEMQALKAQINPHFIFNCLNSIKGFLYEKDFVQADKYLDKFSTLMRSTIDNSDTAVISLKSEIEYLSNYLDLEKLRFNNKFTYQIHVEAGLNENNIFVPAMLLQPYVENAIRHGVRYLEHNNGVISIAIHKEEEKLLCLVDDNGVGRAEAAARKSNQHIEYQSKGMTISARRAELFHIQQQIIDKVDEDGKPSGTTIKTVIPLNLKP